MTNGLAAYVGQLFGAKKLDSANSIVGSFLPFLTLLSLFFTAVIVFRVPLLQVLNTPYESFSATAQYLTHSLHLYL